MRGLVVLGILVACSRGEAPPPGTQTSTARIASADGWLSESHDGLFTVEIPVASTPDKTNPHAWAADPSPDISYGFAYVDTPQGPDLDGSVRDITGLFGKTDRISSKPVLGRPARQIWGTESMPAQVLLVADGDRLFMLHVHGTASSPDIERFFGSLKIH